MQLMNIGTRFRLIVKPNINLRLTPLLSHQCTNSQLMRSFCVSQFLFTNIDVTSTKLAKQQQHNQKAELKSKKDSGAAADLERTYLDEILIQKEAEPKTTGQKVKRAVETTFYISFGLISCAVLGVMTYLVFKEFFAFNTPQGVYRDVVKRVKSDERCRDMFGKRIMTFGEESGRGRRRHILHKKYIKDGQERLNIMFHAKGDKGIGRVYAEIFKREGGGSWAYRFILVETEGFAKETLFIIDNRKSD